MGSLTVARALTVRLLFACHGLVSIWRLYYVTKDSRFWYLSTVFGFMLVETSITLVKKQGKEWKWFCPSVFIYLISTVPAIWFLELHELEKRISVITSNLTSSATSYNESLEDLSANLGKVLGVQFEIRLPIKLTPDQWIRTLEQILLLILIMGRWILPKGKLTHDQLSQLLLVYIGTAADIVEFFEAFKEDEVRYNKLLCIVILGLWSLSLIQFTLVLTAARARRDQSGLLTRQFTGTTEKKNGCCAADVYGILISILLQDLPFLVLRLLLIFRYKVLSYTNMFFTSKNSLVIILLLYRLVVVYVERKSAAQTEHCNNLYLETKQSRPKMDSTYRGPGIPRSKSCNSNVKKSLSDNRSNLIKETVYSNGNCNNQPKIYRVHQEKNNCGRNYHFQNLDNRV